MSPTRIGLWLPPRTDLNKPISPENPAHIDARISAGFPEYLRAQGYMVYDNLDYRDAVIHGDRVWLGDFCLSDLDHFVWMGMIDRGPESYHLEVLRVLEMHVQVHNSWSFFHVATDKFSAFSYLHRHGLPVSDLYLLNPRNYGHMEALFEEGTWLLKPRRSHFGKGIVKVEDFDHFRDIIEYNLREHYYLERFHPNDMSQWTGLTVINGEVIYGFRKDPSLMGEWKVYDKNNVGGKVSHVVPDAEQITIAKKIAEVMQGNYFGLDLIKTADGYRVVDINNSPGIYHDFIESLNIPFTERFFSML